MIPAVQKRPSREWAALGEVEVLRGFVAVASLRAEWDQLLDQSAADVFNSWEWMYPWLSRLASDREPMILTVRDRRRELLGLLPLCIQRIGVFGRTVRRVSFLAETEVGSDYLDLVARRGFEEQVAASFAAALKGLLSSWDVIDLLDLPSDSLLITAVSGAFAGRKFRCVARDRYLCPYERFEPGETFDVFLRRTGRRDNYLRRKKWFERQTDFHIERQGKPAALPLPLAEFFRLHHLRWADSGGSQGIAGAAVEGFHREAAALLAERGRARFYTLRLGGQALASVYAIVHGPKFIFYQSGFDPAWSKKSVGLVLLGETFKDAIELGFREYDFLHGTEPYKAEWTSRQRRTISLRIFQGGTAGEWFDKKQRAQTVLRGLVKKALPQGWIDFLRASSKVAGPDSVARTERRLPSSP